MFCEEGGRGGGRREGEGGRKEGERGGVRTKGKFSTSNCMLHMYMNTLVYVIRDFLTTLSVLPPVTAVGGVIEVGEAGGESATATVRYLALNLSASLELPLESRAAVSTSQVAFSEPFNHS